MLRYIYCKSSTKQHLAAPPGIHEIAIAAINANRTNYNNIIIITAAPSNPSSHDLTNKDKKIEVNLKINLLKGLNVHSTFCKDASQGIARVISWL